MEFPARLSLPEVLALAGYSRSTLRTRQKAGRMPWPIDRGGRGGIYQRDAVLKALGLLEEKAPEADPWAFNPAAYEAALAAEKAGAKLQRNKAKPPRI
jgi:predicted DNA-binding transcriptional regulator AlpA